MTEESEMFGDDVAPADDAENDQSPAAPQQTPTAAAKNPAKKTPPKKKAAAKKPAASKRPAKKKPAAADSEQVTDQRAAPRPGGSQPARVADEDIASAAYLQVNQECPFTDRCPGRLRSNIFTAPTDDEPNGVKQMQLFCPRCRVATKDTRRLGGAKRGTQKLYDRRTGE